MKYEHDTATVSKFYEKMMINIKLSNQT